MDAARFATGRRRGGDYCFDFVMVPCFMALWPMESCFMELCFMVSCFIAERDDIFECDMVFFDMVEFAAKAVPAKEAATRAAAVSSDKRLIISNFPIG